MVSFNKCRSMYPTRLNHDDMSLIDPIFHAKPQLLEFMKPVEKQLQQRRQNNGRDQNAEIQAAPVNVCYKDKSGTSYGLYQRFYWDAGNVPFGGYPNFQSQGPRGPGIGVASSAIKSSTAKGGKFAAPAKEQNRAATAAGPGTYFLQGRDEIKVNKYSKFDTQKRELPGDIYQKTPDYNNTLL